MLEKNRRKSKRIYLILEPRLRAIGISGRLCLANEGNHVMAFRCGQCPMLVLSHRYEQSNEWRDVIFGKFDRYGASAHCRRHTRQRICLREHTIPCTHRTHSKTRMKYKTQQRNHCILLLPFISLFSMTLCVGGLWRTILLHLLICYFHQFFCVRKVTLSQQCSFTRISKSTS